MSFLKKYIGDRSFYKMALLVAVPIMIQNGITNFVSMLDNIMVGAVGQSQMTGVSISNTIMLVFNLAIFGAISGAGIFGAQFAGNKDEKGVRYAMRYKLYIGALLTLLGIAVFYFAGESLIRLYLMGEGDVSDIEAALGYSRSYQLIMLLGLPAFVISQCYAGTLRENGQTVLPMVAGIVAVAVNLVCNVILINGLFFFDEPLGSDGAAIATVISRYVELFIVLPYTHLNKKKNRYAVGLYRSFYIPRTLILRITGKAVPLMFNETLWSAGVALLTQCYSLRGYDVVTAVNISSTVSNVANVTFLAMGMAIGIIVGQQLGAGNIERAKEYNRKLTAFSIFLSILSSFLLAAVSKFFPLIYKASNHVHDCATALILVYAVIMPFCAYSNACYFALRSGGKTLITVLFDSVFVCLVSVPMAFLLSRFTAMPIIPLYFCTQGLEMVKCIVGFFFIRSGIWVNNLVKDPAESNTASVG